MSLYAAGWQHFAAGRYFEAHDAWEELWLADRSEARSFYQGLIQAAAALHHRERGRSVPYRVLLGRAAARLRAYPSPYLGVDVEAFLAACSGGSPGACWETPPRIPQEDP